MESCRFFSCDRPTCLSNLVPVVAVTRRHLAPNLDESPAGLGNVILIWMQRVIDNGEPNKELRVLVVLFDGLSSLLKLLIVSSLCPPKRRFWKEEQKM